MHGLAAGCKENQPQRKRSRETQKDPAAAAVVLVEETEQVSVNMSLHSPKTVVAAVAAAVADRKQGVRHFGLASIHLVEQMPADNYQFDSGR